MIRRREHPQKDWTADRIGRWTDSTIHRAPWLQLKTQFPDISLQGYFFKNSLILPDNGFPDRHSQALGARHTETPANRQRDIQPHREADVKSGIQADTHRQTLTDTQTVRQTQTDTWADNAHTGTHPNKQGHTKTQRDR